MTKRRFSRLVAIAFSGSLLLAPAIRAEFAAPAFASVVVVAEDEPTGDGVENRDEGGNLVEPTDAEHTGYDRSTLTRDEVPDQTPVEDSTVVEQQPQVQRSLPWLIPLAALAGLSYWLRRRQLARLDPNGPLGQH